MMMILIIIPRPVNTKHLYNICTTSAKRLRRRSSIVFIKACFAHFLGSYDNPSDDLGRAGVVFSYKLRYIVGFGLVEMAISTNPKPKIYPNLYDNTSLGDYCSTPRYFFWVSFFDFINYAGEVIKYINSEQLDFDDSLQLISY